MATSTVTLFVLLENLEPATPRNLHIRTSEKNLQYHCCSRSPGTLEGESGLRVSLVRVFRAFLHRLQEIATSSHHPRGLCNITRPLGMICNCTGTLGEIMVAFFFNWCSCWGLQYCADSREDLGLSLLVSEFATSLVLLKRILQHHCKSLGKLFALNWSCWNLRLCCALRRICNGLATLPNLQHCYASCWGVATLF